MRIKSIMIIPMTHDHKVETLKLRFIDSLTHSLVCQSTVVCVPCAQDLLFVLFNHSFFKQCGGKL